MSLPDDCLDSARALAVAEFACAATGHAVGIASSPAAHFRFAMNCVAALDKTSRKAGGAGRSNELTHARFYFLRSAYFEGQLR